MGRDGYGLRRGRANRMRRLRRRRRLRRPHRRASTEPGREVGRRPRGPRPGRRPDLDAASLGRLGRRSRRRMARPEARRDLRPRARDGRDHLQDVGEGRASPGRRGTHAPLHRTHPEDQSARGADPRARAVEDQPDGAGRSRWTRRGPPRARPSGTRGPSRRGSSNRGSARRSRAISSSRRCAAS